LQDEATKLSEVACKTVYSLVDALSASFDSDHLQPREALLGLVARVLRQPDRANAFWAADRDSGMHLLVKAAAHFFPAECEPLLDILTSLATAAPEAFDEVDNDIESNSPAWGIFTHYVTGLRNIPYSFRSGMNFRKG